MIVSNYKTYWVSLFLALLSLSACKKWVTVPPPETQVTAAGAFANDLTAEATVAGLYSQVMSGSLYFLNGGTTLYPALSADELYATAPNALIDQFTANAIAPQNSINANDLWGKGYAYLYQVNACLEGIKGSAALSEGAKAQLSGEMLFMRALCFFYLTNLYGAVPLPLTTAYAQNATLPRADTATVYQQVKEDLVAAKALLRNSPISTTTRPSYAVCTALLARVYLYRQDWHHAAAEADTLISSSHYRLEALDNVFLTGSQETIFAFSPVIPGVNTAEGLNFIPYDITQVPPYGVQDTLLAAFEPGDNRKTNWLDSTQVNDHWYYYPYKYKVKGGDAITENNVVLRLAEQYLIRAEARAHLNDIAGATEDINTIRARAGLAALPAGLSQTEVLNGVMQENQIEFFAEWGHRWLDLKRRGRADAVLGSIKSGWQPTDVLYPIPYSEIQLNPALTQNPGY